MALYTDIMTWSDLPRRKKAGPPPLPEKEPPVILPKEILTGARQLNPEEIGDAVLKEVTASRNQPKQNLSMSDLYAQQLNAFMAPSWSINP